ncbi:hypothetical protein BT96DRAFT_993819 [Gymnopus androsaceus JB14]|uniref:Uncharacterized protein n=1 Tax=Gymnopus androsaceus JB14 TaxID=1447944 RepID=A0A6A4HMF5_9AGAR|nr:hypothetical protein BT96DRAFT_993819 [Gymnopus androsaceus JB14]
MSDYTFASFVFERLQPFFSVREVADAVEQRDELIWAVKHGARPGLYLDIAEAIASVDNSKTNSDGRLFQEAFAFRSFTKAIRCQMLNDTPRTAVHAYNPMSQPKSSAALRRSLLEEGVKEEPPMSLCAIYSSLSSSCSQYARNPGSYHILFSPNVELRINSPNPESPGPASPARRARAARAKGIDFGRRVPANEGLSSEDVADIEEVLLGAYSAEMFIEAVGKEEFWDALTSEKAQVGSTARKPWRIQAKRIGIKLTAGQKAEKKKQRAAQKESYKEALLEVHQQIYAAAASDWHGFAGYAGFPGRVHSRVRVGSGVEDPRPEQQTRRLNSI